MIKVYIVLIVGMMIISGKVFGVTLPVIPGDTLSVTVFGVVSSDTADYTKPFQKAIDSCSIRGGGTILVPAGIYLSGPLKMKNKVDLYLSGGAILKLLPYSRYPYAGSPDKNLVQSFISGAGVSNVKVSGSGTIDGQGQAWWDSYLATKATAGIARPSLIYFSSSSSNIEISGITLLNAPNVNITVGKPGVTNTTIRNVTITAPSTSPNTDGIDVWSGSVDILNCTIADGDDNIALDNDSKNILIKGCKFGIGHGCSIGSYSSGIENVTVDSCTFNGTDTGIRMKTARDRGGVEQNLTYSNLTMVNVATPISILSYYPKTPATPSDNLTAVTVSTPTWENITLKNITATGATYAGNLWGLPEKAITNLVFDNVQITATNGMNLYNTKDAVFKNNSSITVTSGKAITATSFNIIDATSGKTENIIYQSTVSGINFTTGKPTDNTSVYTIAANVVPAGSGTVTGVGSYLVGTSVTLTAKPNAGYAFVNWTEVNPTIVIADTNVISFASELNRTLVVKFKVSIPNGIEELSGEKSSFEVFPNPCKENLVVKVSNEYTGELLLSIYDETGLKIATFLSNKTGHELVTDIDTRSFASGMYFIRINLVNDIMVKKFIVQQ